MKSKRTTVRDIRRNNRRAVLSRLFFDGSLSRPELTRLTGLSVGTISTVTSELVAEGVVTEAGLVDSDGGRPKMLLRVDPSYGYVVGVDVGETQVRIELFDLGMAVQATVDVAVDTSGVPSPEAVVDTIVDGLHAVVEQAGVPMHRVLGMGIGVFGTVEHADGAAVVHAQTVGWASVELGGALRSRGVAIPVFVDNGAKTLGQAEMWFGAGRGSRHVVVALVGSGVGAALVAHGSMYQGATSSAAEWGHTTIQYGGRTCRCGARGCLEAYIGAGAILDRYREAGGPAIAGDPDEKRGLKALLAEAETSRIARAVLAETTGYLGAGLANLVNLFNPERVVLGGWAGLLLGQRLLPDIRRATEANALRHLMKRTSIGLCQLGPDAVAFGAATLPVAELLSKDVGPRAKTPANRAGAPQSTP